MADNTTVAEETRSTKPTSLVKGQSASSGTGSMSSTASSKHSLKHGLNISHLGGSKATAIVASPEINKHHHHHHHHHHHGHSHNNPHVIHRTTSESLRLGSDIVASSPVSGHSSSSASTNCNSSASNTSGSQSTHVNASVGNQRKPKTSSFQITSVTVGNKLSADNGEDSADDLDESHTDDNSRITDLENETPSVSEDTFSKEDVFFSSNALGAAPVIPTSSQYGLVIVDPDLGGVGTGGQTLSNVHVSVTDAGINIVGPAGTKLCDADQKDLQHRNERFKVVKIESTEPFKRGRWMCMDYLDHTTLQQSQPNSESSSATQSVATSGNPMTNDSGVNVTENHVDGTEDPPDISAQPHMSGVTISPGQTLQNPISVSSIDQPHQTSTTAGAGNVSNSVHAQTLTHVPNATPASMAHQNAVAQSLPHVSLQQNIQTGQQQTPSTQPSHSQTSTDFVPVSNCSIQGQSQPAQFYANSQQQNISSSHIHGATLPSNITMQNGVPTNLAPLPEQPVQQQQQEISQPIQPVQPVQQIQSQQNAAISSSSIPASAAIQEHGSISVTTSISQPIVPQPSQAATLPAAVLQNVPQTQVSNESYAPHSVPQSFATPPIATSTLSNVAGASVAQEISTDASIAVSQTPQTSGVISPAGAGTPSSSTVPPSIDASIQPLPAQSGIVTPASAVIPEATSTAPSSISDPTALVSATQSQPQVPVAAPSLQSQQSVIASEESQSVAGETDNERVSSLALALSSTKRPPSKPSTTTFSNIASTSSNNNNNIFEITTSPATSTIEMGPHFRISQNLINLKKIKNKLNIENLTNQQESSKGVFTDLALGKCELKLMSANDHEKHEQKTSLSRSNLSLDLSLTNIEENLDENTDENQTITTSQSQSQISNNPGIPIPSSSKQQHSMPIYGMAYSASPTFGANRISPFFCDTLVSPSSNSANQVTTLSFDTSSNHTPNLKEIGKTFSTPLPIRSTTPNVNQFQQSTQLRLRNRLDSSASGTSAVAIDNKIEQAMDLVKSHLMIAVREEVEVLKEKIAELMDRINQLELENTILKANVSQETLSQLTATIQTASTNPSPQTTVTTTTTTGQQQQQPSSQTVQKPPSQNTNTSNGSVS